MSLQVVDAKNLRFQLSENKSSSSFPEAYLQIAFAVLSRYFYSRLTFNEK